VRKLLVLGSLLLVLCGVSGCGANADSLIKEQIKAMNDLAEALETKAPEAKVNEVQKKLEVTDKKLQALKLSDDEKKQLTERHKDEMTKASMRLAKAGMNKTIGDFGKVFGEGFPGMPASDKMPGFPK
jgi:hypothetical protein